MKKYTIFFIFCSVLLFAAITLHADQGSTGQQWGFTGPSAFTGQQAGFSGAQGFQGFHGFMGPSMPVSVAQVVQTFPNKAHAVLRGNIVQHLGGDRYLFRDSSGDIVLKIKHNRWWGLSVGPNDLVEIDGELKRDKRTGWINYFDGKVIRRAL